MQLSPTLSASGSPSWSVGTMQACSQDPENVLSAKMQQCLPGQQEVGKDNPDSVSFEQLQEERSRLFHVQRENNELRNRLSQLQQQHRLLESRCIECEQVRQAQEIEVTKQNVIIQQLRGRLAHLQSLADTVAQEVHTCSTVLDGPLNPYLSAVDNLKAHTEALGCGKHVVGAKDLCDSQDQLQAKQLQRPAAVGLGRLLQLQQQIEQAAPAAPAEAASTGGRLQPQAPTVGSKRSRLCSATGSAGDAVVAANMKHAASGGSSSSRQQMSGEDEPLDEGVDEVEPNGVYSIKMQHSPSVSEQLQAAAGRNGAVAANADQMDVEGDEEKSQDDLEAAECLQALATSCAEVHDPAEDGMLRMPSSSLSYKGIGSMMAAAARAISGSQNSWPTNSQSSAAPHGNTFDPVLMASALHSYLQGAVGGHAEGHEQFNMAPSGQQAMVPGQQRKGAATAYTKSPSQLKQLHHQHHVVTAGAPGIRRPDGLAWGAAPKGLSAAGMSAPVRARKQSWFQTEISEKIPVSVQQACIQDWAAQQCMQVVCAEMEGTFYVNSAGEYLIKLSSSGEVVTPNKFEELAGKKTARNWQQSIRLRGYTMNGEPNSALLKLGHFTRIVGLVQDR